MEYTVYILFSEKLSKHYIGFTENLNERLLFHSDDIQTRKFTFKADDWVVKFQINCESKNQALSIEKHIKAMKSSLYIENLIQYPEMIKKLLDKYVSI
jgi:putative endonuclease